MLSIVSVRFPAARWRTCTLALIVVAGALGACTPPDVAPDTTGSLELAITSLPPGITAAVTVSNGQGYSRLLTAPQVVTGLPAGTYTVAAGSVTSGGVMYAPSPETQSATVLAGAKATATIMYAATPVFGNLTPGFHARSMTVLGATYQYQVFVPQGYTPTQTWPVILFVHGSGERGSDNQLQLTVGLGPYIQTHSTTFPAVVVFPQMPNPSPFPASDSILLASLDRTLGEVRADSTRIYLTGISFGAIRAWELAYWYPARFAAFVPIAGDMCPPCMNTAFTTYAAAYTGAAQQFGTMPIWQFNGGADFPQANRDIAAAFALAGSTSFHYTEYAGIGHDVWTQTYADPSFWTWLFTQHR